MNTRFIACGDGRLLARLSAASLFSLGAITSATVVYGGLGLISSAGHATVPGIVAAIAWLAVSVGWHLTGRQNVPLGRKSIQANRRWAQSGPLGTIYFGSLLGVGFLTDMTTPLVIGGALLSVAIGTPGAVLYGLGFAAGRSSPAFAGALRGLGQASPGEVAFRTVMWGTSPFARGLGAATGLLSLGALTLLVVPVR